MLPKQFWRSFVRDHLEAAALHHRPRPEVLFPRDEVFGAMVAAGTSFRRGGTRPMTRLFIGDSPVADPTPWLPSPSDRSYDAFLERVVRRARRRPFLFIWNDLQSVSFPFYARLRELLTGLFAVSGVPPYVVDPIVFLGNYEATAFGIHRDRVGVLMHTIEGEKTMRVWPREALDDRTVARHRASPKRLYARAQALHTRRGDIAYWPAESWHIGESHGLSLTVNIGLGMLGTTLPHANAPGNAAELLLSSVRSALGRDATLAIPEPLALRSSRWPASVARGYRTLVRAVETGALERDMHLWALKRRSALGFNTPPPRAPSFAVRPGDRVRADPRFPISWARHRDEILVAANGHAAAFPFSAAVEQMLRRLSAGGTWVVADLVAKEPERSRRHLRSVLTHLGRARALEAPATPVGRRARRARLYKPTT